MRQILLTLFGFMIIGATASPHHNQRITDNAEGDSITHASVQTILNQGLSAFATENYEQAVGFY